LGRPKGLSCRRIIGGLIVGFVLRGFGVDVAGGGILFSFLPA
jgi:hypothetical protein